MANRLKISQIKLHLFKNKRQKKSPIRRKSRLTKDNNTYKSKPMEKMQILPHQRSDINDQDSRLKRRIKAKQRQITERAREKQ